MQKFRSRALSPSAEILMNGATALGLTKGVQTGFCTAPQRCIFAGVPVTDMIRHHAHFYRDMADPVALLRDQVDTELSHFWPYVLGPPIAPDAGHRKLFKSYGRTVLRPMIL